MSVLNTFRPADQNYSATLILRRAARGGLASRIARAIAPQTVTVQEAAWTRETANPWRVDGRYFGLRAGDQVAWILRDAQGREVYRTPFVAWPRPGTQAWMTINPLQRITFSGLGPAPASLPFPTPRPVARRAPMMGIGGYVASHR